MGRTEKEMRGVEEGRTKLMLGSFFCWRMKKFLAFACCVGGCAGLAFAVKSDFLGAALLCGIIAYDVLIHLPCVKRTCCEVMVRDDGDKLCIRYLPKGWNQKLCFGWRREAVIRRDAIRDVRLKEIRYGGRWMGRIGYRMTVRAEKDYRFDSVLLQEGDTVEQSGLWELRGYFCGR